MAIFDSGFVREWTDTPWRSSQTLYFNRHDYRALR